MVCTSSLTTQHLIHAVAESCLDICKLTLASVSMFLYRSSSKIGFTDRKSPLQVSLKFGTGILGRLF